MLGKEIRRDRSNQKLFICQQQYSHEILSRFGMENSARVSTPMDRRSIAELYEESKEAADKPYRQAIGSLMYLMISMRKDIAFAVGKLSQFVEKPTEVNWNAVKRVLRYLQSTKDYGILYDGSKSSDAVGYSEADWAGCLKTRKSTSGKVFLIAVGAVSWKSKKQTCVATSTCEAEYVAMCLAAKEVVWSLRLLSEAQGLKEVQTTNILVDNNGSIDAADNSAIN